jgi:AhpD family alkylhydroperoxidase
VANIIRYVPAVPKRTATGLVGEVYRQARREIGMLPEPVTMLSADPELAAASWAAFREPLVATGKAPRASKEAVAATVSTLNQCPYCVDAHSIMLYGSGAGDFATQLLAGRQADAADPGLRAVSSWVEAAMRRPDGALPAPFPADHIPEMVGTLVYFQFLNRAINILLSGTFLPGNPRRHGIARRIAGRVMSRYVRRARQPGVAPGLHSDAPLPDDLRWAAPAPNIAAALAWLAAVTDAGAERSIPPTVRPLLADALSRWSGQPPGLGASWVDEPVWTVPAADRSAARLALLTALASYQVTDADVAAYRADHPADADLLALVGWASLAPARTIGSWAAASARTVPAAPAAADAERRS